jgi:hypothetical protein
MDRRTLLILFGVALALASIWFLIPEENSSTDNQLLFPGLKDELNTIEEVTVSVGGDQGVVTLERGTDQWTVAERYGYPADVARIRKNLIALGNAAILEKKTSNPEFHERLGIEGLDDPDAKGYLLEIHRAGPGGDDAIGLIVGNAGTRGNTAYVRRPGEDQGLMISADFDLSKEPADWLASDLMDVASADIMSVTISHADGEVVRIEKSSQTDPDFSVLDIPDGRELNYASIANPVAGLLTKLTMDKVLPAESIDKTTEPQASVRFETFDGLVVEATTYTTDDGVWVGFKATADESQAAKANELNSRLESWIYSLPSFKSDQLGKRLNDFLKADGE